MNKILQLPMNKILQLPMNKILHYYTLTILFYIPTLPILALARLMGDLMGDLTHSYVHRVATPRAKSLYSF